MHLLLSVQNLMNVMNFVQLFNRLGQFYIEIKDSEHS